MSAAADLRRAVLERVPVIMAQAAVRVKVELKAAEPRRKTGELAGSQFVSPSVSGISAAIEVGYGSIHANYTNDGTSPHVINGRPWLYWPGAEHPVRRVNHPGNRGTKWFTNAISARAWTAILSDCVS